MRPSTFHSPGLGDVANGQIQKILRGWSRQQKKSGDREAERRTSFSANKRKKQKSS